MSRVVSSSRFNPSSKDPESEYKVKKGDSKQQLAYGSKKMRNQANCIQYFVKNDLSRPKAGLDGSKSVIIDKERTRTLKKSITRTALIPSESEFYEKVNKQLAGKLAHTKDRSPLKEIPHTNSGQNFVRTMKVVDDDLSRKSLGTLAEEVSYVPKLLSRGDSSHKKPFNSSFKFGEVPMTKPFNRFDSQELRPKEQYQGFRNEWSKTQTNMNLRSTAEDFRKSDVGGTHSGSAYDVKNPNARRSMIRQSPSNLASNSSAGLAKKWEFIEEMENKIDMALERSRSRGKLIDFTHGVGNFTSPGNTAEDLLKNDRPSKDQNSRITHLSKISDLGYLRYAPGNKRDMGDSSKENISSAIELRDLGINRPSYNSFMGGDKPQIQLHNPNSDNKFFQPRSSLNKNPQISDQSDPYFYPNFHIEDHQDTRKSSTGNIEKILNDIKKDYSQEYDKFSEDDQKHSSPMGDPHRGIDIENFSSFKESKPNIYSHYNQLNRNQVADKSQQESPIDYKLDEKQEVWRDNLGQRHAFDHLSSFSGGGNIREAIPTDKFSTPSLMPGLRSSLDWSKSPDNRLETASKSGFGEPSSSRNANVELNSNFCKRFWSLRFTSSQELKVLVAESIIFIGDKKNGLKCGKGKFITEKSGVVLYEGQFYDNLYHGLGKLVNPKISEELSSTWYFNLDESESWLRYEGLFVGGLPEGQGSLFMRNGDILKGKFVRGRITGLATIHSSSGALKFTGEWLDNVLINQISN